MDPSPEPVETISAITLKTVDMAGAVAFYRALQFPLVNGGPDAEFTSLRAGSGFVNLQLDRGAGPPPTGWGRIILWVDDVDVMHRRCLAAGFSPLPPLKTLHGANGISTSATPTATSLASPDPWLGCPYSGPPGMSVGDFKVLGPGGVRGAGRGRWVRG